MTRVLVVEDEISYSEALTYLLRKEGYEVNVAETGPEALELFDRDGLAAGSRWAIVTPRGPGVSDADVVDEAGRVLLRLEGYRTIELPGGPGEPELAPIREAMS